MSKLHGVLLLSALCAQVACAAPSKPIQIEFNQVTAIPHGAAEIVPGVLYANKTLSQYLFFDKSVKPFETITRKIYFPKEVKYIRPFLNFRDKEGNERYWYCKKNETSKEMAINEQDGKKQLVISVSGVPAEMIAQKGEYQRLDCTYSWSQVDKAHHKLSKEV